MIGGDHGKKWKSWVRQWEETERSGVTMGGIGTVGGDRGKKRNGSPRLWDNLEAPLPAQGTRSSHAKDSARLAVALSERRRNRVHHRPFRR